MTTPAVQNGFLGWFTVERRQAIQLFALTVVPFVVMSGYATQAQAEEWLIILGAVLGGVASLLNLVNVRRGDAAAIWAIIRGTVYSAATVISPALMAIGFYGEDVNIKLLTGISLTLTALSSGLAIFTSGRQQKYAVITAVKASGNWGLGEELRQEVKTATTATVLPPTPSQPGTPG